jgi:hypothetical protein
MLKYRCAEKRENENRTTRTIHEIATRVRHVSLSCRLYLQSRAVANAKVSVQTARETIYKKWSRIVNVRTCETERSFVRYQDLQSVGVRSKKATHGSQSRRCIQNTVTDKTQINKVGH